MSKNGWLWTIAIIVTLLSVLFQRMTGPSYPISGKVQLGSQYVYYRLERSHDAAKNYVIQLEAPGLEVHGKVMWRKANSVNPNWIVNAFVRERNLLKATLPRQEPAQKLEYKVTLEAGRTSVPLNKGDPIVIRFRNEVPNGWLIPHILFMFGAMLFAIRAGLGAWVGYTGNLYALSFWTNVMLWLGGIFFGCIVQQYAFGAFWTGFPLGYDLTDNKTLLAIIIWGVTLWAYAHYPHSYRRWIIIAAIVTLIIFCIPHSMNGLAFS